MQQISAEALHQWLNDENREKPLLLDVREPWEFERCHIAGAELVPMREIPARAAALDADRQTVVICHHGIRSAQVGMFLENNGFANIINLQGGVAAWAERVDPSMARY